MAVVAMMRCHSKGAKGQKSQGSEVTLQCVTDTEGEYKQYFAATPYGECTLGILSDLAADQFIPGATYKVTFEPVEPVEK